MLGLFALVGNAFVVVWRTVTERSRTSSFFIINLGAADLLMGLYLLIVASVDVSYRGQYIVYADQWRGSRLCQFAGILSMLSSEVSIFMLCAITGDRLFSIMFPLKVRYRAPFTVPLTKCSKESYFTNVFKRPLMEHDKLY